MPQSPLVAPVRSLVPDLIYADYRRQRSAEVLDRQGTWQDLPPQWRRLTLFTTFRCNLDCVYCKTTRVNPGQAFPAKERDYDLAAFQRLLECMSARPLGHVHFTGGEATLLADLPAMVEAAARRGILTSTTSNGYNHPEVYQRLVEAGLDEVRISFDSHLPQEFDRVVRRPGAFRRVVASVEHLVRLREARRGRPFVILNACVGMHNRRRLPDLVRAALALGPDDLKLIPVVQTRQRLADFPQRAEVLAELRKILAGYPAHALPLLRYKLERVFAPEVLGLKDLTSRQLMRHCLIPLAERTMDTTYYYPCSVYLREGGQPLGRLDEDDLPTQQRKIAQFAAGSSCYDDPICLEYCIGCCKQFNLLANADLRGAVWEQDGSERPLRHQVTVEADLGAAAIEELRKEILRRRDAGHQAGPPAPFLVIKPGGLGFKGEVLSQLEQAALGVERELVIPDWNRLAPAIYVRQPSDQALRRSLVLAAGLPLVEGGNAALALIMPREASLAMVQAVKARLRRLYPPRMCLIRCQEELVVTALNLAHVPDPPDWRREYQALCAGQGD